MDAIYDTFHVCRHNRMERYKNMKKLIDLITEEVTKAFVKHGYEEKFGTVTFSNRPDLCQFQCNGALAAAKQYKKAPIMIANEVVEELKDNSLFGEVTAIMPGFINMKVSNEELASYLTQMAESDRYGIEENKAPKTIVIDYGGPNVAKPLHVGHLRSAIIGESIKRIQRFVGNNVIGDVHLGDWGLQMGLIITELKERKPELVYFDESFEGEYPEEAPFTITELEEIYPTASGKSKVDEEFRQRALRATYELQNGNRGYQALWNHILNVSVSDLKKNYEKLNVTFDLWKKESDAQPYIPGMVDYLKEHGYAEYSEGALVVDVKKDTDTKEIPPCIVLKSDGSSLYATTDLATIVERMELFNPDAITYVVDKRQELHFEQVFRTARKAHLCEDKVDLTFLGFGTMNGKDGKPFKTREGGIMRLEVLIRQIADAVYDKIMENREMEEGEARKIAEIVGLAALKYADLSNQASKDYIFDIDRFTSFEGNTGPYILYTIVRIKSIIAKYMEVTSASEYKRTALLAPLNASECDLMLEVSKFSNMIATVAAENAPHKICQYIYDLANAFNRFYHENKIIGCEDEARRASWISLISLVSDVLTTCIDLLGFEAPERM